MCCEVILAPFTSHFDNVTYTCEVCFIQVYMHPKSLNRRNSVSQGVLIEIFQLHLKYG